ncbi:hypothetical protein Bca52824_062737 [Brassica carinata]|uniref:Uncharacterized protein n=1 Tax=Brassica carinata TaxID=52824 RepID=A0A8X7QF67_BRACI|nr:hypothetical protein Bca52824_062737 [Brassica carinata]
MKRLILATGWYHRPPIHRAKQLWGSLNKHKASLVVLLLESKAVLSSSSSSEGKLRGPNLQYDYSMLELYTRVLMNGFKWGKGYITNQASCVLVLF